MGLRPTVRRGPRAHRLELARHAKQARALEPFALAAKSAKPLDPSIRSLAASPARAAQKSARWKLLIHAPVELDA